MTRKLLVMIGALGAALTAAPSMAQSSGSPDGGYAQRNDGPSDEQRGDDRSLPPPAQTYGNPDSGYMQRNDGAGDEQRGNDRDAPPAPIARSYGYPDDGYAQRNDAAGDEQRGDDRGAPPPMSQSYGTPGGYAHRDDGVGDARRGYDRSVTPGPWQIRQMVERAIQRGDVSPQEARALRDDVADLMKLDRSARRGGNDWGQQREIEQRSNDILARLPNGDPNEGGPGEGGPGYDRGQGHPQRDDGYPAPLERDRN